jgi:hypothetical protein
MERPSQRGSTEVFSRPNLPRVAPKKIKHKFQIRFGDHLLIAAAGLVGALGDAEEFPQDRAGIEALIKAIAVGPDGEEVWATYEDPDAPITYLGGDGTWVAPAGGGRLRIRQRALLVEDLASNVWVLGPEGSLSDPEPIESYGIPDDELPESVRAELAEIERRRQKALAGAAERERRGREDRDRFRVGNLRRVVAGPASQDPTAPLVSYVALYEAGLILHYLSPRPRSEDLDPDDPWAASNTAPQKVELDDGCGTEFRGHRSSLDTNGTGQGMLRCRREFSPAPNVAASRLVVTLESTRITIELGPA